MLDLEQIVPYNDIKLQKGVLMDKLLYESQSFLLSLRMGASLNRDNNLLKTIEDYQKKLIGQSKFNKHINYNQNDLLNQNLKLSQIADSLKSAMEAYMEAPDTSYRLTNFLYQLHYYKMIKSDKEQIERVVKEQEKVVELFGDFAPQKQVKQGSKIVSEYKSSEELINERNDRLAMLNQMHVNGDISDKELEKGVVYVRRTYNRNIENQTLREVSEQGLEQQKENTIGEKIKAKAKSIISKVSKAFKINVENVEIKNEQVDLERQIIDRNAAQSLGKVADILAQNNDLSHPAVLDEITELGKDSIEIIKAQSNGIGLTKIAQGIYNSRLLNAKNEEDKEYYRNKIVNFGEVLVADRNGEIIPNTNIESQKQAFDEYMWKTYETKYEFKPGLSIPIASFKDENIEKFYWNAMRQFDQNIAKVKEMIKVQDVVKNMTEQNQTKIENSR